LSLCIINQAPRHEDVTDLLKALLSNWIRKNRESIDPPYMISSLNRGEVVRFTTRLL
jgi:hypothetical protein